MKKFACAYYYALASLVWACGGEGANGRDPDSGDHRSDAAAPPASDAGTGLTDGSVDAGKPAPGMPCPSDGTTCADAWGEGIVCNGWTDPPVCTGVPRACPTGTPESCDYGLVCYTGYQKHCPDCPNEICVPPETCDREIFAEGTCSAIKTCPDGGTPVSPEYCQTTGADGGR
jgi:hypothetical protein